MLSSQTPQPETISELIRQARVLRDLTQAKFGQLFNPPVAQPTVARWEKGDQVPDRRHFPVIAELLDWSLEDLFQFVEQAVKPSKPFKHLERLAASPLIPSQQHLNILYRGVLAWNRWREKYPNSIPRLAGLSTLSQSLNGFDLRCADLRGAKLSRASLFGANLMRADLSDATLIAANLNNTDLRGATLVRANLSRAHLVQANLKEADLRGAMLQGATLIEANLRGVNLTAADLTDADLRYAILTSADLTQAILSHCAVYGISAWDIKLKGATQRCLNICPENLESINVDRLELAQTYALIHAHRHDSAILELKVEIDSIFGQVQVDAPTQDLKEG